MNPEQLARRTIDRLLQQAGWQVSDVGAANIHAHRGLALREFPLPFSYQSSGGEHRPEHLAELLGSAATGATKNPVGAAPSPRLAAVAEASAAYGSTGTFLARLQHLPPLKEEGLWPTHIKAINNLEQSLRENRPRALIQMATGSGKTAPAHPCARGVRTSIPKTFTAISFNYRLIKFAGARRVLFLVDRGNLGDQPRKDKSVGQPTWSHKVRSQGDGTRMCCRPFGKGNDFAQKITYRSYLPSAGGAAPQQLIKAFRNSYFPRIAVTVGEAGAGEHPVDVRPAERARHGWRALAFRVERDARAKKVIATGTDIKPVEIVVFMRSVKSRSFFEQMKGRGVRFIKNDDLKAVTPDAVSKDHFVIVDAVGVCEQDKTDSKPMEKKPAVSFEKLLQAVSFGNTEEAVLTSIAGRLARMEHRLSEDDDNRIRQLAQGMGVKDLSRRLVEAVNPDRIVEAASRRLQEIEAGRTPLTGAAAENYPFFLNPYAPIEITRANMPHWRQDDVIYFVTFRLADSLPRAKLEHWREQRRTWIAAHPKPWNEEEEKEYYHRFGKTVEQWLDRGEGSCVLEIPEVRNIVRNALRYFEGERYRLGKYLVAANHVHVIVQPLPGHPLSNILHSWKSYTSKQILKVEAASRRLTESKRHDALSTVEPASRRLTEDKRQDAASTVWQKEYYDRIVRNPQELYNIEQYIECHAQFDRGEWDKRRDAASTALQEQVRNEIIQQAVNPLHDPKLRELLVEVKKKNEITIDHVSQDEVIEAGFSADATERARGVVQSFEQFIEDHKDEITALQILYSKPYKARLSLDDIKELADQIQAPPNLWTEFQLWQAYAALEKTKLKGAGGRRILTDLVSLVRFAIHQDNELVPFPERVQANFKAWVEAASRRLKRQDGASTGFTEEQMHWLELIRDHIAANLGIETDDFEYAPFAQEGGLGRVYQLFGNDLQEMLASLNDALAA